MATRDIEKWSEQLRARARERGIEMNEKSVSEMDRLELASFVHSCAVFEMQECVADGSVLPRYDFMVTREEIAIDRLKRALDMCRKAGVGIYYDANNCLCVLQNRADDTDYEKVIGFRVVTGDGEND